MNLVADWRRVLVRSLSFWMQVLGALVLIVPELRFYWTGRDYDPQLAWWAGLLLIVAGLAGRLVRQNRPWWQEWLRIAGVAVVVIVLAFLLTAQARATPATETETLRIAVPFIAREEGERLSAYIPVPGDVATICHGSTRGVQLGMMRTHAECLDLLRREVAEYRRGLHAYFKPVTINRRLPSTRDAAYTSTAFNCGVRAIGNSTATNRLNAGNIVGGCEALTWWNKAGGRVLRGLFDRRKRERALCLVGAH